MSSDLAYRTLGADVLGTSFEIAVPEDPDDPIARSILDGTFDFPLAHRLGFALLAADDVVVDLGAHLGTFALGAAALGCRVIAFEASPRNARVLAASLARNAFAHPPRLVAAAAGADPGTLRFLQAGPFGHVIDAGPEHPSVVEIPARRVEDVLAEAGVDAVDLAKIDVEGSELRAIAGMSALLGRRDAPAVVYESNGHALRIFGEAPGRLVGALAALGYASYLIEPGALVPIEPGDLQPECVVDCLAVKQAPALAGWPVRAPFSREELIARVVASCGHPHPHYRAHAARALADAADGLRAEEPVRRALDALLRDEDPEVRAAAVWWRPPDEAPPARRGPVERLLARLRGPR